MTDTVSLLFVKAKTSNSYSQEKIKTCQFSFNSRTYTIKLFTTVIDTEVN